MHTKINSILLIFYLSLKTFFSKSLYMQFSKKVKIFENLIKFCYSLRMSFESITIPVETERENLSKINAVKFSKDSKKVRNVFGQILDTSIDPNQELILDYMQHPIFDGFVSAYKNHRPITISPDIIWILIAQAFSNYVSANHEKLRFKFVNFEGKKELLVKRLDLIFGQMTTEDWASFFPEFVKQISEYTGKNITDTLTPEFTTTTPTSLAVGQLSIMSTMKHYFSYRMMVIGCGIPHITIEGSIEDWQKIQAKLENLNVYDFEWFTSRITPIINKIIQTKKGDVDKQFWKDMIRIKNSRGAYDPSGINGWFTNFFPYDDKGNQRRGLIKGGYKLQKELLEVPFTMDVASGAGVKSFKMQFLAGFVGLTQNDKTGSLKPEIGWIVQHASQDSHSEND